MTIASLHGLPRFLQYLSTFPSPDSVATALVLGPLQFCGAASMIIWRVEGNELIRVGQHGHTRTEAARYAVVPLDIDFAISRVVRTATPLMSTATAGVEAPAARLDEEFWSRMLTRVNAAAVVRSPIWHAGNVVGAYGLLLSRPVPSDPEGAAMLEAVTSALGLWLTHPQSGLPVISSRSRTSPLTLSPRQIQILSLVEKGHSNRTIAHLLRLSESTVKQDLQRAMRTVGVQDRHSATEQARAMGLLG